MQRFTKFALVVVAAGFVVGSLAGCGEKKEGASVDVTPPKVDVKTK